MTSRVGWCIRTTSRTPHIYDSSGEQLDIDLWRRVPLKNLSDFWLSFQSRYLSACSSDGFFSLQETSLCAIDEQLPHRHNGIREVLQGTQESTKVLMIIILPFILTILISSVGRSLWILLLETADVGMHGVHSTCGWSGEYWRVKTQSDEINDIVNISLYILQELPMETHTLWLLTELATLSR